MQHRHLTVHQRVAILGEADRIVRRVTRHLNDESTTPATARGALVQAARARRLAAVGIDAPEPRGWY